MRGQTETGFVPVHGARLYYEAVGAGQPLVFIHAGVADHRMWDEQAAAFAPRYRVIRYDTRCFGQSKTEDVEYANHEDLLAVLDYLHVAKAYLVGASRAGTIATNFTLAHPDRVAALVLVGSGVSGVEYEPPEEEKQLFDEMEELWKTKDFARLADLEVRMWVDGPGQPETRVPSHIRERVRNMILNTYTTHVTEGKPVPLVPPAGMRLAEVNVPTLILTGDLDESGVQFAAGILARGIANARTGVMKGTAHLPNMERPAEFNRILSDFLSSIS